MLGRDCDDRQSVGRPVIFPLAPENNLKMRDRIARHLAAHSVKTEIGDMMLAGPMGQVMEQYVWPIREDTT
jgi:hypothetical protein